MNDHFATCELSASELEPISAGIVITHGPNPPRGGAGHCHQPPHMEPPRYYPGGVPNAAGLRIHY
jgi:hypothetical protein